MKLERIIIVVEPWRMSSPLLASLAAVRASEKIDELADALRQHTRAEVAVVEDFLRAAPAEGLLLVRSSGFDAMSAECPESLRKRAVIVNATRASLGGLLVQHGFAGAVLDTRYHEWAHRRDEESGAGLHGLRRLAPRIGATCGHWKTYPSEDYCVLVSERFNDLPSLIVAYLGAIADELG